jgi:hypothetical protein
MITYILPAILTVLTGRKYKIFFVLLWALMFFAMLYIPVATIPGNAFSFQLELYTWKDFALFLLLAFLASQVLTMHVYIFRFKLKNKAATSAVGGAGILSGLIASVFATASCGLCIASIFSFLGFGGVLFLSTYRVYFLMLGIILLIISLYFASRRVVKCEICK